MDKQVTLTRDQRLYLQQIFDCLRRSNRWPTFGELDRWFTYHHPDLDIEEIWQSLPQGLTNYMDLNQPEAQATLTIPAIYLLENNRDALSIFLALIKLCVDIYMSSPTNDVKISSERILQDRGFTRDIIVRQGGLLLRAEEAPRIWKSFSSPDESGRWECMLDRQVRRFRNVATIEEYLEKRDLLPSQGNILSGTTRISNGDSQHTGTPATEVKKRISDKVMNAVTDAKIKQFCVELNNMPDENVFSLTQCIGEALKWTLWYQGQKIGTSIPARNIGLERLLDEAISRPYYSGNAAVRFLKEFKNNFLKTSYDMVRHDATYIPNGSSAFGPALDALEHILKETFPA
ncbi:MAG TPA: hypothetical protein VH593_09875 [Ktedonobacteraceae bacterium]